MKKTYVGDVGTEIIIQFTGEDISSAISPTIEYRKPNGETGSWAASLSGADSLTYTTITDDLDVSGDWLFQGMPNISGFTGKGSTVRLKIYPAFG